ncbi:hypothetical protein CR513_48003, partial [Mucuna pruriens]
MKFPVGQKVGSVWANSKVAQRYYEESLRVGCQLKQMKGLVVNVLDLDLDLRCQYKYKRPHPVKDLKEVQIGSTAGRKTKISTTMSKEDEGRLVLFSRRIMIRYVGNRSKLHIDARCPIGHLEKAKTWGREAQGHQGGNGKVVGGQFH